MNSTFIRAYEAVERFVVGGFIGWFVSFPLLILGSVIGYGLNSKAGDYIFYFTIPAGAVWWSIVAKNRHSHPVTQAIFGGAAGLLLGVLASIFSRDPYAIFGGGFLGLLIGGIGLPVLIWRKKRAEAGDPFLESAEAIKKAVRLDAAGKKE